MKVNYDENAVKVGDTWLVLLDDEGNRLGIDHVSDMDGYVAFLPETEDGERVLSSHPGVTLQFTDIYSNGDP